MVFNSLTFAIFFAVILLLHNLPFSWKVKKINLLWASYLFYAAWNPPFVILIWISTYIDWLVAKKIDSSTSATTRRTLLAITLIVNLGFLGFFKYSGFLLSNFIVALNSVGISYQPALPSIILPLGISFYTFETISYVVDVYKKKIPAWDSLLDYALFISFFPHLVAGPIVRPELFLPQCTEPRRTTKPLLGWGLALIVLGLFQKVVIADGLLGPIAEKLYGQPGIPDFASAWAGTLAFSGQIFCDFAGYSTCAIGAAMCLGFFLPENFRYPYAAIGFSDFWRRWHISLSSWLRDYVYIPLGGNRKGENRAHANLMLTMLIGGLWHGAAWTFVFWGGLHGLYLVLERIAKRHLGHLQIFKSMPAQIILMLATFGGVCITWVFFRAVTFGQAANIVAAMLGFGSQASTIHLARIDVLISTAVMGTILFLHWLLKNVSLDRVPSKVHWSVVAAVLAVMIVLIIAMPGDERAFIYFQF